MKMDFLKSKKYGKTKLIKSDLEKSENLTAMYSTYAIIKNIMLKYNALNHKWVIH